MTSPTRSTLETLQAARALIADPDRWTTHTYARDAAGTTVDPAEPSACRFCALGAILATGGWDACSYTPEDLPAMVALRDCCPTTGDGVLHPPQDINDYDGHDAVLALYDRAIAAESAR